MVKRSQLLSLGGGGVDGAIHRAGGAGDTGSLQTDPRDIGKCPAGQAVITTAGKMPAQKVIHTVSTI